MSNPYEAPENTNPSAGDDHRSRGPLPWLLIGVVLAVLLLAVMLIV